MSWRAATAKYRSPKGDAGVLVAYALLVTAVQVGRPTASYRVLELGGGPAAVGVIAASYAALAALGAMPIGRLVDRRGARVMMIAGGLALVAGLLASAGAERLAVLSAGQGLLGAGQCACAVSFQTWNAYNGSLSGEASFARLALAQSVGQLAGPVLAGLVLDASGPGILQLAGTASSFVVGGLLATLGLLTLTRALPAKRPHSGSVARGEQKGRRHRVVDIVSAPGMSHALVTSIALITAIDLLIAYLPVVGEARGIGPAAVGMLLSLRAGAGLVSRLAMPALIARFGGTGLVRTVMAVAGTSLVGMAVATRAWHFAPLVVAVGFAIGIGNPVTMAWVAARAPEGARGSALAVRLLGNRVAQVAVPMIVGLLATALGPGAALVAAGTSLLGGSSWPAHEGTGPKAP